MKRELAARILGKTGLRFVLSRVMRWSGVLGLNYHRIGEPGRSTYDRGIWSANTESFDAQIGWLKAHFDLIRPEDLPDVLARKRGRYVLITFDDGYRDNYTDAFPILKRHNVPATFFVTTGFLDNPRFSWWDEIAWMVRTSRKTHIELPSWLPHLVFFDEPDRERTVRTLLKVYKTLPAHSTGNYLQAVGEATGTDRPNPADAKELWVSWDMLREMVAAGMSVGGHTITHPILSQLTPEGQEQEISYCGRRLQEELGQPMQFFSYPDGTRVSFNAATQQCLKELGVRFAFSYYGGIRTFTNWDDLDIRRVGIERHSTFDWFKARITLPNLF